MTTISRTTKHDTTAAVAGNGSTTSPITGQGSANAASNSKASDDCRRGTFGNWRALCSDVQTNVQNGAQNAIAAILSLRPRGVQSSELTPVPVPAHLASVHAFNASSSSSNSGCARIVVAATVLALVGSCKGAVTMLRGTDENMDIKAIVPSWQVPFFDGSMDMNIYSKDGEFLGTAKEIPSLSGRFGTWQGFEMTNADGRKLNYEEVGYGRLMEGVGRSLTGNWFSPVAVGYHMTDAETGEILLSVVKDPEAIQNYFPLFGDFRNKFVIYSWENNTPTPIAVSVREENIVDLQIRIRDMQGRELAEIDRGNGGHFCGVHMREE